MVQAGRVLATIDITADLQHREIVVVTQRKEGHSHSVFIVMRAYRQTEEIAVKTLRSFQVAYLHYDVPQ